MASSPDDDAMSALGNKICHMWDRLDPRRHSRPLVLANGADINLEKGSIADLLAGDRVAIVAGYSQSAQQSLSTSRYLNELARANFGVLYVSTSPASEELQFVEELHPHVVVARRPNRGYDFGTWAVALAAYPQLAEKQYVLLTNDSLVGPFTSLAPLLDRACHESDADIVGATFSYQLVMHLQSFFLMFRGGILADRELALFFARVRIEPSKMDVVVHNELAFLRTIRLLGYSQHVLFDPWTVNAGFENPTLASWQKLLDMGWPFIKKTIIADPSTAPHGDKVAEVVRQRFGTEIEKWV